MGGSAPQRMWNAVTSPHWRRRRRTPPYWQSRRHRWEMSALAAEAAGFGCSSIVDGAAVCGAEVDGRLAGGGFVGGAAEDAGAEDRLAFDLHLELRPVLHGGEQFETFVA